MAKDIAVTESGAFKVYEGDFVAEESDQQHIEDILLSNKGDWKRTPIVGVGIRKMVNAPMSGLHRTRLESLIQRQLVFDGFTIISISAPNLSDLNINAERT